MTIAPRSPSAFGAFFCISAAAALQTSSVPTRLISMTLRKKSPGIGPSLPTMRFGQPTPAQFTATLMPPMACDAAATAAFTAASEVTSVSMKRGALAELAAERLARRRVDVEQCDTAAAPRRRPRPRPGRVRRRRR